MAGTNKAILMTHTVDPKQEITDRVGDLADDLTIMGAQLLVAVYVRPEKTRSGIILSSDTRNEDKWQGKVGLVLKCGPLAFEEDATHKFGDRVPVPGDWIVMNVGDTFAFELGEQRCRVIEDVNVKMITKRPDIVL